MKLPINYFPLLLVFLIMGCENHDINATDEFVKKIDEIPVSKTVYIFEIDSNENTLDTLAQRKLKYDNENNLIFENNFQLKYNIETANYYVNNDMIYSIVKSDNKIVSKFRGNLQNKRIVSAYYLVKENGTKDSVSMKYRYTFEEGKKIKLDIDSGDGFNTIELYNELEKPLLNFSIHAKDTLEKTEFIYNQENLMEKKRIINFSRNEEVIYDYEDGFLVRESFFKNNIKEFITDYSKDKKGNYLSYTKTVKDSI